MSSSSLDPTTQSQPTTGGSQHILERPGEEVINVGDRVQVTGLLIPEDEYTTQYEIDSEADLMGETGVVVSVSPLDGDGEVDPLPIEVLLDRTIEDGRVPNWMDTHYFHTDELTVISPEYSGILR